MPCSITLEFRGGAELLFGGVKEHSITLPDSTAVWTIRSLLDWICKNLLHDRQEMFVQGSTVRPGILVLVNNMDWELCGELDYNIADRDTILFISTLHGG